MKKLQYYIALDEDENIVDLSHDMKLLEEHSFGWDVEKCSEEVASLHKTHLHPLSEIQVMKHDGIWVTEEEATELNRKQEIADEMTRLAVLVKKEMG